jgi:hypothetical protein
LILLSHHERARDGQKIERLATPAVGEWIIAHVHKLRAQSRGFTLGAIQITQARP